MASALTDEQRDWYYDAIDSLGNTAVILDRTANTVTYNSAISSDESHVRSADHEELAHAVMMGLLHRDLKYPLAALGHEIYFKHGSSGSNADEVDILIRDQDALPYAVVELKSSAAFPEI